MRTFAIWTCGLLASLIIGSILGDTVSSYDKGAHSLFGGIGGMLLFACARLWLASPKRS